MNQNETPDKLQFRVHVANMFNEILNSNDSMWIMNIPLKTAASILHEVGTAAARINDPELNALMCRLAIYAISDPCTPDYDAELTQSIIDKANKIKYKYLSNNEPNQKRNCRNAKSLNLKQAT